MTSRSREEKIAAVAAAPDMADRPAMRARVLLDMLPDLFHRRVRIVGQVPEELPVLIKAFYQHKL